MQKWEYTWAYQVSDSVGAAASSFEAQATKLGADGWEMVNVTTDIRIRPNGNVLDVSLFAFFKRPL